MRKAKRQGIIKRIKKEIKGIDKKTDGLYLIIDGLRFILIIVVIIALCKIFVVRKEVVVGTSMYPTLKNSDSVFINVAGSLVKPVKRFDVVVAKRHGEKGELWVKRVIGLPGDLIQYKDDVLYVNGKKTAEPFLRQDYIDKIKKQRSLKNFTNNYKLQLTNDEYLLVGDNRVDSLDSRDRSIGPFQREQIIADGVFVFYPLSEMRYIGNGR